jgi:hypothetical protein
MMTIAAQLLSRQPWLLCLERAGYEDKGGRDFSLAGGGRIRRTL